MPEPRRTATDEYMRSGVAWQPVERETVYKLMCVAADAGVEFTEGMAAADLLYWHNRQQVKPCRYYAARWKWGKTRAHEFMQQVLADKSGQSADNGGQVADKTAVKEQQKEALADNGGQVADKSGQSADSIKDPRYLEKEKDKEPEREDAPAVDPDPPKVEAVKLPKSVPKVTPESVIRDLRIPPNLDTEAFRQTWQRWVARRFKHKTPKCGWVEFFSGQLEQLAELEPETRIATMKASIANDWQGLYPDKHKNGTGNGSHQQTPGRDTSTRRESSHERRQNFTLDTARRDREALWAKLGIDVRDPNAPGPSDPDIEGRTAVNGEPRAGNGVAGS